MRLSKITTRTGDKGTTGIADGTRIRKDHARIAALGSVDELNSLIGMLLCEELPPDIRKLLLQIQNDLFDLGGELALPAQDTFPESKVAWLDKQISHYNDELPPLKEFILPGGSRAGAMCHVVRSVGRRCERDLVLLMQGDRVPQHALPYLNRLSDLMFVLSRSINRKHSLPETLWRHE